MATNSRAKGARYERAIAKLFTDWAREQGHHCEIRRTPMSGGWTHSKRMGMTADIVASCKSFPFVIECKNRQKWSLAALLARVDKPGRGPVWRYWEQCLKAADGTGKMPLVVMSRITRRKQIPDLCLLRATDWIGMAKWAPDPANVTYLLDPLCHQVVLMPLTRLLQTAQWLDSCECDNLPQAGAQ